MIDNVMISSLCQSEILIGYICKLLRGENIRLKLMFLQPKSNPALAQMIITRIALSLHQRLRSRRNLSVLTLLLSD